MQKYKNYSGIDTIDQLYDLFHYLCILIYKNLKQVSYLNEKSQ